MTNIRKFSYFQAPIANITPATSFTLEDIYTRLSTDKYKLKTEQVRADNGDKTKILPYVTFSGTFTKRANAHLVDYSGYLCADLDHIDIQLKDTLAGDTVLNPALIFISPRLEGLKVVINIENASPDKHLAYFQSLERYFKDTYQLAIDEACKDVSRACFLCHDPAAYFNHSGSVDSEILLSYLPVMTPALPQKIRTPAPKLQDDSMQPSERLNRLPAIDERAKRALEAAGWTFAADGENCTRPGKDPAAGTSGKFNRDPADGLMKFTNFSSAANIPTKGFTSVQVINVFEFNGDFNQCIGTLAREYLTPSQHQETASKQPTEEASTPPENRRQRLPATPPLPIDGMPEYIRNFVTTCSDTYGTSRDYWALSTIMATALGIGDKIVLTGKYENIPLLWGVNIGPVSNGKTEPQKFCFSPFEKLDKAAHENWQRVYQEYQATPLKDRKKQSMPEPVCFQYIIKDTTPEALTKAHSVNKRGLAISRDELNGMLDDYNRYAKSGEQSNMLSSFMRVQWVTNRKGGGSDSILMIDKPCIFIFGGIQSDMLSSLAAENRAENGFLSRMCFAWPDNTDKSKYNNRTVSEAVKTEWDNYIIGLINTPKREITLSAAAESLYEDWFNRNVELINSEQSGHLKGVYGKLDIISLRLAVVIYGMNLAKGYVLQSEIKESEMKTAIDLTEYFRATAQKVHEKLFTPRTDAETTREVIKYLAGKGHSQSQIAGMVRTSQPYINKVLKAAEGGGYNQ